MPTRGTARRRTTVVFALLTVLGTIAAACSSTTEDGGGSDGTTAPVGAEGNVTLPADGPPRSGGTLRFGTIAETDGFNPTVNRWAGDGTMIGTAIFDPLAAYTADGSVVPYLASSFTPNDDFTEWTITLRDGVTFHDGSALDSAAVKGTMEGLRVSVLGAALAPIVDIATPDDLTVVISLDTPWASYPVTLTGQAGVVAAPSQLADPDSTRNPVGTGPFRFVSWENDRALIVERYDDYWRTDEDGNQLPYLDGIEFRPIADDVQRVNALETGEVDMMVTLSPGSVIRLRDLAAEGAVQVVEQQGQTEVNFVMLNLAAPPFDDPNARLAIAHATDREQWADIIGQGITEPAETLFRPGTTFYADVPTVGYDLAAAQEEVAAYEAEHGPFTVNLKVLSTPLGRQQGELLQQMWGQAGIEVEIDQAEGTAYLGETVLGDYQAASWLQFGSPDPDYEQVWWRSSSVAPIGQLSLNFPRNADPEIDDALADARSTDDRDAQVEAYARVQERLVEDLPYLYLDYAVPAVGAADDVRGITNGPLPDGEAAYPIGGPGSFSFHLFLTQTWLAS